MVCFDLFCGKFKLFTVGNQDNAMCIEECDEKNEATPRKFLPTVKNIRNAGQSAITPQTVKLLFFGVFLI